MAAGMKTKGNSAAGAVFSDCEHYRYRLWRVWDNSKPKVCFAMLNPSVADENQLDPTVSRCQKRAQALGYGGFEVVNIFALRSTDPHALYDCIDPLGSENFDAIAEAVIDCEVTICAWGSHGKLFNLGKFIHEWLTFFFPEKIRCFKLNSDRSPAHPLYLPYSLQPVLWEAA
jgi:hypothetical protein